MNIFDDTSLVDWSRWQFALTAMYHWLFVPLTLGTTFIIAIMETIYVKTGDEEWKKTTKFWMKLFGINFAIGVATGIILEFEFGTNWSNYSWFVGDIFGAPLAIEGIFAFFLESTFIAVMFFGWDKVSKQFHLVSSWLVAIGANLSALWILVANGWMQNPVGMKFNPDIARNEMVNFWDVILSPTATSKFLHTITSGYVLGSIFVIGVSAWFLLKKREVKFAKRSIIVATSFGLLSSFMLALNGDWSAKLVAKTQPMKFAAMEGLYNGGNDTGLTLFGVMKPGPAHGEDNFMWRLEVPNVLSFLIFGKSGEFVPGINDLINGYEKNGKKYLSAKEKMERGAYAMSRLKELNKAKNAKDFAKADMIRNEITNEKFQDEYFKYFGYGAVKDTAFLIPNVALTFYSFHIMFALGCFFILLFLVVLILTLKNKIQNNTFWLRVSIICIPLVFLASQAGWIVAEVGRQPWVIQDLMTTTTAVTRISSSAVQITFWLFFVLFTTLLIAELRIMFTQIKKGPKIKEVK
ncbi:MAG: cytochrome ubiquinol oxidase subunit I [Flavobacteriales bacterium]